MPSTSFIFHSFWPSIRKIKVLYVMIVSKTLFHLENSLAHEHHIHKVLAFSIMKWVASNGPRTTSGVDKRVTTLKEGICNHANTQTFKSIFDSEEQEAFQIEYELVE
ncbi:hypothetical protein MTR_2g023030 [Medicago truncatula]|uniref:Uncharacterized protein n=1 Tax=Medicago truncatula TaxID=3880 RepID=A0A072VFC9_MEDTR|nr:hypothetical protein MTR_2g023030 [Medicago truncatula]